MSDTRRQLPMGGPGRGRMGMHPFGFHGDDDQGAARVSETRRRMFRYMSDMRWTLFLVVALATVSAIAQAAAPIYIAVAVDRLQEFLSGAAARGDAATQLTTAMVLVLVLFAIGWLTNAGSRYALAAVGQRMLMRMRGQIMSKVHQLSLSYFDRNEAGDLLSRLVNDTDVINRVVGMGLSRLVSSFLLLIAILTGMLWLNWRLALATFALLPLMYLSTALFSKRARTAFRKTRTTISGVSTELEQNISGAKVAQAFNRQSWNSQSFRQLNRANRDANVGAESLTAAFAPTMDIISGIGIAVVLAYGGYLAGLELVTIGVIVAFLQYERRFFEPVRSISMLWAMLQSSIAGAERIFELLDLVPEVRDRADATPLAVTEGRVEFNDVHFAYDPDTPVLKGMNLVAEPGRTVALVGTTGAGKTTIISLLERFYDVQGGSVTIDGHDLRTVTQDSLRSAISIAQGCGPTATGTVCRHHPRQHQLRSAGRQRCRDRGGGAAGARPRVHRCTARRLRHHAAGGGEQPEPRPAPTAVHRARVAEGSPYPGARRGNLERRHPYRVADPGGTRRVVSGTHQLRDRAPAEHRATRRRDLRDRRWPSGGARLA